MTNDRIDSIWVNSIKQKLRIRNKQIEKRRSRRVKWRREKRNKRFENDDRCECRDNQIRSRQRKNKSNKTVSTRFHLERFFILFILIFYVGTSECTQSKQVLVQNATNQVINDESWVRKNTKLHLFFLHAVFAQRFLGFVTRRLALHNWKLVNIENQFSVLTKRNRRFDSAKAKCCFLCPHEIQAVRARVMMKWRKLVFFFLYFLCALIARSSSIASFFTLAFCRCDHCRWCRLFQSQIRRRRLFLFFFFFGRRRCERVSDFKFISFVCFLRPQEITNSSFSILRSLTERRILSSHSNYSYDFSFSSFFFLFWLVVGPTRFIRFICLHFWFRFLFESFVCHLLRWILIWTTN